MRSMCIAIVAVLWATACSPNDSGNTSVACQSLSSGSATPLPQWTGTVFTIAMENHSQGDILGNGDAPYINSLAATGAVARGYHDPFVHPSEPNYFWMVAGENFGVLDDDDPSSHHLTSTSHVVDQIEAAGLTWKSYQENMGQPCGLVSQGRYAAKHDPFVFFDDVNGWDGTAFHPELRCNQHVVDYSQLDVDLAAHALPKYVFITPDLDDDMHDGSVQQGDAWLQQEVPKILGDASFQQGGVLFLLWDEGSGLPAGDDPPFITVSPNAKPGFVSQIDYDTSSYLKTVENIIGLQPVPCSTDVAAIADMSDLFSAPLTAATTTAGTGGAAIPASP